MEFFYRNYLACCGWNICLNFYSAGISNNSEQWGQFGDYLGGVLNPIFSASAFIVVVISAFFQSQQLEIAKKAAQTDELLKVAATSAAELDQLLALTTTVETGGGGKTHIFETFLLMADQYKDNYAGNWALYLSQAKAASRYRYSAVCNSLEGLAWSIRQIADIDSKTKVLEYYSRRYGWIVDALSKSGHVISPAALEIFDFAKWEDVDTTSMGGDIAS